MPWYSFQELNRRFDDIHLLDTPRLDAVVERLSALQRYGLSVRQRRFLSRHYARILEKKLDVMQPDVIISVGASHKLTALRPGRRIIHVSDGLFGTMVGYYEKFGRFRQAVLRDAHVDHQRFIDKIELILFASEWARGSALELYDLRPEATRVVPFGANLDSDPPFKPRRTDGPLVLLFIGYDWKRKGGDLVLRAWTELRRLTGDAELHIVGCKPADAMGIDGVTVHGRLDKGEPGQRDTFTGLFERASFFFMPSREEAFGMVFCEASAYGLPSVGARTGGVPMSIEDGVTGILLPLEARASAYVDRILALWNDKPRYVRMSEAARAKYETTLNWRAWGKAVEAAVNGTLAEGPTLSQIGHQNQEGKGRETGLRSSGSAGLSGAAG